MDEPKTLEEAKKQLAVSNFHLANAADYIGLLKETIAAYKRCIYMLVVVNIATVVALLWKIHELKSSFF